MKRIPQREKTRKIAELLRREGKKKNKPIYIRLSEELLKPRRNKKAINLWKLSKLAEKFPNKWLITPRKVLGFGNIKNKIKVIGFEFSKNAEEKLRKTKCEFMTLEEILEKNISPAEMVIVK